MRLDKFIGNMGYGTRSEVKKEISRGHVTVNGEIKRKHGFNIDVEKDIVNLNGSIISHEPFIYVVLNKPQGVITATKDSKHKTVMDLLGDAYGSRILSPVGRLDIDTEGLLIITDDGQFNHEIMSPKKHVSKTYFAEIEGQPTMDTVSQFEAGIDIGEMCKPAKLTILEAGDISHISLEITEGKFHQVKRMFEAVNMKVVYLKRVKIGSLVLEDNLELGEHRKLSKKEVELIRS